MLSVQGQTFGVFINLTDTIKINCNNTIETSIKNKKKGVVYKDNIVIFNTDTFAFKQYNNKAIYYLYPLKNNKNVCKSITCDFFYLQKEYWPNGTLKRQTNWKFYKRKGFKKNGNEKIYDPNGNLISINKYKKGRLKNDFNN